MISKPTTLILGAGASAHAGYPLGMPLLRMLCSIRLNGKYPQLPNKWSQKDVNDFLLSLSRSGHYSIDAFLERSENRDLGKYLIAHQLKEYENIDQLFPPSNSGWYQTLFSALIEDCEVEIGENKLFIITFNYDRSLEAYLHNALGFRYKLDPEASWGHVARLPIVHVHGILGDYPEAEYQVSATVEELVKISEQIKIIHELEDNENGFCNGGFELANRYLSESERIIFLGFGFHEDNIRRFNFFNEKNLEGKEIHTTLQGFTMFEFERLRTRLEKYGFMKKIQRLHGQDCEGLFRNNLSFC